MEQYIQKSALVEEIEKWLGETDKGFPNDHNLGRYDMCKKMLSFIDTLEMKEQMMAKAVDGDITFDYYGDGDKTYGCIAHDSFCLEDFGLKDRDKVKVIVIKKE